ncbi:transcriptional regulator, partial [Klebsiella pneumoniae]|nr:transcriptional regulator [Klebsiella pneumoniae]
QELFPLLVALRQWGERHRFSAGEAHSQLIESSTRRPLPYMQPHGRDGQPLQAAATRVRKLKDDRRGA